MTLTQRTLRSASWKLLVNPIIIGGSLVRTILLARWLPIEVFGVVGYASAIVSLSASIVSFGMGPALLHRSPETRSIDEAASIHFSLKLIFVLAWAILVSTFAFGFTKGETRLALLIFTFTTGSLQLTETAQLLLIRMVEHKRLAVIGIIDTILSTFVALIFALKVSAIWALLISDIVTVVITVLFLFLWKPIWRPKLSWSWRIVKYFLSFGSQNFLAGVLWMSLDRIDDIWTGSFLGNNALALYSRAYAFATYPRTLLASPINNVVSGALYELKEDRKRLSYAFSRSCSILFRASFFLGGILALIAPEFITLFLGIKWLPMINAFRLMLIFTMFDPLRKILGHLFSAVGHPASVIPSLLLRLLLLIVGLALFSMRYGIAGVAVAVDIMLLVGILILFWQAKNYVDYSFLRLIMAPLLSMVIGILFTVFFARLQDFYTSIPIILFVKICVFTIVYCISLLILDYKEVVNVFTIIREYLLGGNVQILSGLK